ncbi:MAG: hypothetical protein ABGW69_00450 [Nanoarchaeota archaeon]
MILNKKRKIKRAQVNVVEFILLMTISLLVVYEFYNLITNFKYYYVNEIYSRTSYIIADYIINNYADKKFLKDAIKAKNITYYIYLPTQIFPGGYYITSKNITINNKNYHFLVIYSSGNGFNTFVMSYPFNKEFHYGPGRNKEIVD